MDDSDQDFSDLCSRLLKRVRRREGGEPGTGRKRPRNGPLWSGTQPLCPGEGASSLGVKEKGLRSGTQPLCTGEGASSLGVKEKGLRSGTQPGCTGDGASSLGVKEKGLRSETQSGCPGDGAFSLGVKEKVLRSGTQPLCPGNGASSLGAKEKVLRRMERFRRESPPRLLHVEGEKTQSDPAPLPTQEIIEEPESDEALAQRLQEQLDCEAEGQGVVDMDDGGLFFCQLCHKDLSAMCPQLRAQHINRCLDESENSTSEALHPAPPPPPPPRPRLPECPICGRGFKSEKSRSTHLKRCSVNMGVSPAELLLALQRQAAQNASDGTTDQLQHSGGSRRVEASESSMPVKKKSKRRAPRMDEDTMVALALSRSLLEREKEREKEMEEERQIQAQLSNAPAASVLQWRPGAGKSRKRRKGVPAAPPPLLLVQDPQAALNRIQERVSSLLLCPRPPTPPTPKLPPSTLPLWTRSAPLWLKSALPGGGPDSVCEFYCPELGAFIQPWVRPENKPSLSSEVTPVKQRPASSSETSADPEKPNSLDQKPSERLSSPGGLTPTGSTPGSRALQDLVELAEEGMTLTQYRHTEKEPAAAELPLSGFVPETTQTPKPPSSSVSVSRLCSDLASMVNNPQLSDVQLQVDGGDVYFAHSFMLYSRCPLLASMVHDAGFGVQEDGMPAAQRLLLGDVPGEAVHSLLQYLYTALCPLSPTLLPHVLQLATRFDLPELQQQCERYSGDPEDFSGDLHPAQEPNPGPQQSLAETQFLELLRSMWQHEESDGEEYGEAGGTDGGMREEEEGGEGRGDGEIQEERVNEDELDEIYEFAATQRKMERTAFSITSNEEEEEDVEANECSDSAKRVEEKQNAEAGQRKEALAAFFVEPNTSRHSYRLGEDKDAAAMATSAKNVHHTQSLHADVCLGSKSGDLNPDASLDRSYNRLFSESWGDYVEPSQAPAASSQLQQAHQQFTSRPRRMTSVSEVIDLSVSPPPGSGEPGESSLPVAGVSPGEEGGGKPALNTVPPLSPSAPTSIHSEPSPPIPLGPAASCKHSSSLPSKPKQGLSSLLACNSKPQLSPPVPSKSQPVVSPPEPELIVLSDCSDDMDPDPLADKVLPQVGASSPSPSPPRPSQRYTLIRVKKDSIDVPLSSKIMDEVERCETDLSEGGPCGSGGQSLLDGSAEVSWLIPATPEVSTRSSSTQTHSSIRRTRLFPVSHPSSSSCAPDNSERSDSLRKGPASSGCSSGERSGSDVPEHSSTFRTPQFVKQTHPSPPSDFMPSSSTPLHSAPCPQPPEPLGSPLLRDHKPRRKTVWHEEGAALSLSQRVASAKTVSQIKVSGLGSIHLSQPKNLLSQHKSFEVSESLPGGTCHSKTESDITRETGTRETEEEENRSTNEVEMVEEASFLAFDEPPIPFDDSWGLGGGGVEDQGPRFSLRLESSGDPGSSSEHCGQGELAAPPTPSPPGHTTHNSGAPLNHSLPDPGVWDNWEEDNDEDEDELPLSARVGAVAPPKRVAQLKTPVARKKNQVPLVPITPMPGFSDMDTPDLKKRLDRYGVRPLPKKQMVLKLKEIHQYTHQVMSSESEEEASPVGRPRARLPSLQPALSFKQPSAPPPVSPRKLQFGEEEHVLPASQDSNTSSTAESERSNPELCDSDDDGSDSEGITASQAVVREKDKLLAVRSCIQSDPVLYSRMLQYQPLSLFELKAKLKAAGISLGTAKLLDFLDSQCITFTTAKPGHPAPSRRRARGAGGRGMKRVAKPPD